MGHAATVDSELELRSHDARLALLVERIVVGVLGQDAERGEVPLLSQVLLRAPSLQQVDAAARLVVRLERNLGREVLVQDFGALDYLDVRRANADRAWVLNG